MNKNGKRTIAIHQPDFFPWLGFFDKMAQADCYIVFDHVQAPQGKSWLTRNRIRLGNEARWFTLPVKRSGKTRIADLSISSDHTLLRKHLGTLRQAYQKAPFFEEIYAFVQSLYASIPEKVADFNFNAIKRISEALGLKPEFVFSSNMEQEGVVLQGLGGNELVLELCRQVGAERYISGTGCLDFIEPWTFAAEGIEFWFQDFKHPKYKQVTSEEFISHLSILDVLFNVGFSGAAQLISQHDLIEPERLLKPPESR
ncbi:MAG: hypothetical protein CMF59_02875 [Leptospiraceae bacterium]|nr:hypothetical protein [Leptospiraceae bacterium]